MGHQVANGLPFRKQMPFATFQNACGSFLGCTSQHSFGCVVCGRDAPLSQIDLDCLAQHLARGTAFGGRQGLDLFEQGRRDQLFGLASSLHSAGFLYRNLCDRLTNVNNYNGIVSSAAGRQSSVSAVSPGSVRFIRREPRRLNSARARSTDAEPADFRRRPSNAGRMSKP